MVSSHGATSPPIGRAVLQRSVRSRLTPTAGVLTLTVPARGIVALSTRPLQL